MHKLFVFLLSVFCAQIAFANPIIERYLETPEMVGSGQFKAMFWKIYDAELYANDGEYSPKGSFALNLIYSRDLSSEAIADKSIELIRRQGIDDEVLLAAWHKQLRGIFPDVERGTEIVGVQQAGLGAKFYADGEPIGELTDPALCESFFGIWLSEDTVAPKLRKDLLALDSE